MASNRRSHKKSRKGCTECKRRHIRCDERQPSCANCEVAARTCVFPPPKAGEQRTLPRQVFRPKDQQRHEATTAPSSSSQGSNTNTIEAALAEHAPLAAPQPPLRTPLSDHLDHNPAPQCHAVLTQGSPMSSLATGPQHATPPASMVRRYDAHNLLGDCPPILPNATDSAEFTLQHMIILHHAETVPNLTGPNRSAVDIAFRYALRAPYLLDEVLAFTAFHMSSVYPEWTTQLQRLSTKLQTRALASFTRFTERNPENDQANAVPRFLFTAILGRHVLADTLTHCRSDFRSFIDRFVECFDLNRSIRTVTPTARNFLRDSEIQPFFNVVLEAEQKITSPGKECDDLRRLMDDSDLNDSSITSCRQAIDVLQWSFDLCRNLDEENYPQAASAFVVRVEAGFADVLRKHRPEALAILAHYGVLLYRCRTFWAFGDAGETMVRAITAQLGSYWKEVLVWPLYVLETERK